LDIHIRMIIFSQNRFCKPLSGRFGRGVEEIIWPHEDLFALLPDMVVAFRGWEEKAVLVKQARDAGIRVVEVR
jgi:hypothetical protein